MRILPPRLVSGRSWWGLFALLVAVPALALSWLGLRAVRADRLQAEQQLRIQQQRIAELADAAIQNALAQVAADLRRLDADAAAEGTTIPADAPTIVFQRSGLVVFPRDRVYFGAFGRVPPERARLTDWSPAVARQVDQAQALEIQGRSAEAIALFERIGRADARLQTWSAIAAARIRVNAGAAAISTLADAAWAGSDGVTPSGLPAAVVACAASETRPAHERAAFTPLLRATLDGVRSGRWWLSADERRFYDKQLRALLEHARAAAPPGDERFAELTEIDQVVRQFPPARRDRASHGVERGPSTAFLMVWTPLEADADAWKGIAVSQRRAVTIVGPLLARFFDGQPFGGAVRGASGELLWRRGTAPASWHSEPLRSLRGWEIAFTQATDAQGFVRREWLWYGFISVLFLTLLAGIGMTAHVVRREMELSRMQAEFVGAVTHEFKSPITSIRLLLERVATGRVSSPQSGVYYSAIGQETDRLERLVNRLLEAQRIEAGQRRYAFEPESIEELTSEVVRHLQPIAEARNIRIDVETNGSLPPIPMDRAAIADAIENLIDNAIKYSRGGTRVQVRLQAADGRVSVDVADQGIGIERDELARVFDKFYRARRGDLQSVRGTGLGLALVKAAAEAHGGSVDVESEPGVGSRFSLKLPA